MTRTSDFAQCARATISSAQSLYGASDASAVKAAWEAVGVLVPVGPTPGSSGGSGDAEPNNSRRTASPLAADTSVTGEISTSRDVDYYRFALTQAADLDLKLSGLSTDLDLKLYDARGRLLARSEQPGSRAEKISGRANRGAYYVRVFAPHGSAASHARYALSLAVTP